MLTDSHSPSAIEQAPANEPGETGDQDRMGCEIRPRNPHDQAHIGDEPVIGAEHGGAQRVAAHPAMPALQARQRSATERAWRARSQRLDDARMRPFGGRQPAGDSFGLRIVSAAVQMLERIDRRQHESRAEAPREPSERAGPETGAQLRHAVIDRRDVVLPVLGVGLLDRRQAPIDLRQLRVLLGLRQGPVEGGAVDLALKIGRVAPSWIFFGHLGAPCAQFSELLSACFIGWDGIVDISY